MTSTCQTGSLVSRASFQILSVLRPLLGLSLLGSLVFGLATTSEAGEPGHPIVTVVPSDDLNGLVLMPSESPGGAAVNFISVRNSSNEPVANASVVVTLTPGNPLCGSAVHSGTTNENGEVTIALSGGGCVSDTPLSGIIKANGVTLRAYENVKSPDSDGDLDVGLSDLIVFSDEFLGGSGNCHDYNNNGTTGLSDLTIFGPAFSSGESCAP